MTQIPDNQSPVHLSVHETSDPSLISPNPNAEASGAALNDLNDSVDDDENVDVPTPESSNATGKEEPLENQITIANLSAG
ncbi:MAG: hypothetical protein CLLPBCKN_008526 [Chroococcidiopsis cubana SAG 39.79]|uniref:Uncharacterized protein n=1 Tax=Chroococcidiopsis cubana SAG 39.79 TaxID=388085 RepID=A0AB37UAJ1_9CYAN|nr:hypothetical protein [Chroococcidiopsis cubana]MDZ4879088.1 hypothetical protein [Chroococcidiopsis cubana SAG 39.79]PSB64060.1 hypothetical protein C7B79_11260 [Chroococcidiopsis cubana CCALA 043]RUT01957.1 hypothetical protein DSM107010_64290 [Chroococcidiopsis cubana SAG 39.79]